MKHFLILCSILFMADIAVNAQMNVGSNTAPDSSAMLQISGTGKGFLPPRMSRDTMLLIHNPAKGLVVFNTTDSALFMRRDSGWVKLFAAGTVTSASIVSANGISGTVATSTTTPAISLTLGAITPSSVVASGSVTGSNLSGTNTGDETQSSIQTKLGQASSSSSGYLTASDWNTFNNKATTTNTWSITGNAGTNYATHFLGTTDNKSLRFRTNNVKRVILDSIGNMALGTDTFDATNPERFLINAGNTTSVNGLVAKGSINNYFQMNIKNLSSGNIATSDIVATADNGTETSNYVDLGINGSGYTGSAIQTGIANDGYLISSGNDFYMVNSSANKNMLFLTGGTGVANERMRILANGHVGMGVQDPTSEFVVKDTMEIRRTGTLSQLLFTNTAGTGDFRIGGDGGDLFWQGGGGRSLQMGSYWTTILTGDRQTSAYPAFISALANTGVLVLGQRDASVPLGVQANSGSQSANLTEWRNSSGTVLSAVTKDGNFGIGISNPSTKLHIVGTNPLTLNGVQTGANTDSILTIINGTVKKLSPSALTVSSSNAWGLTGNTNTLSNNYFLGTTNMDPLIIKVNSQITGRLDATNTYLGYQSGYSNSTTANQSTGIGYHALFSNTSGTYNTAIGYGALQGNVSGGSNIGIGYGAGVSNNGSNNIAIGTSANINNSNSIAIGNTAQTNNNAAISIGNNTYTSGAYGIAIGSGPGSPKTQAASDYAIALGYNGYAGGTNSIAIGSATNVTQSNAISIGNASSATANNSVAIGYNAAATTENTIVLGDKSNAAVSVAIGSENFSASPNREKLLVDATTIGSFNVISARGNLNNYLQLNVQNKNAGANASSDLVATTDNGDENNNYVDLGINSSGNTSGLWGAAGDAYLYSQTNNMLIGTAGNSKVLAFLTGGGTQSSNERMRIDGSGNVGIGTTSPSTKLHIVGTNPLTLTGVQTGTSTSADSLLTITSGLVKKIPISTFTSSNSWSVTGNSGTNTGSNFLGTTDFRSLKFRTNNTQRLFLDSLGNVAIGSNPTFAANAEKLLVDAGTTSSYNLIAAKGNYNNYLQFNISNQSSGGSASSDVVATADNGTETTGFIDMGINSSGNSATGAIGGAGTAYLYSTGNDLAIGNGSANKSIVFFTGGTSEGDYTERFRLDASGRVGIGTKTPASDLSIFQSSGTGSSKGVTFAGNSIGGTSSGSGFLMSLGYNTTGNKQIWFGDPDYANNSAGTFLRVAAGGTNLATLDAVAGDNSVRRFIALGTGGDANAGVMFGNDANGTTNPSSFVWDNGNMAIGNGYKANAAPSNGLLVQGELGVGTPTPSNLYSMHIYNTANFNTLLDGNNTVGTWLNINNSSTGGNTWAVISTGSGNAQGAGKLVTANITSGNFLTALQPNGNFGIGQMSPTAVLHLKAGTTAAGSAPLKLTTGTNMTTPEAGAVEFDGTNYFATSGTTRYTLAKTLTNTGSLAFNSTAANTSSNATTTITVTGAVSGDVVILGIPSANGAAAGSYSAYVSANDTVTVKFTNNTTGAVTPATGTFRASILKY